MTQVRPQLTPGPDHPIALETLASRVVVRSGSLLIAETDRALEMREVLTRPCFTSRSTMSTGTSFVSHHHTYCPYKGEASYYDITDGDGTDLTATVWYYDDPFPTLAEIKGHVAFYADRVTVSATPRAAA